MSSSSSSITPPTTPPKRGRPRKWATDADRIQANRERLKDQGYHKKYDERDTIYRKLAQLDESDSMKSILRHLEMIYKGEWRFLDTVENRNRISQMISELDRAPSIAPLGFQ